jgi:hypothetical protein
VATRNQQRLGKEKKKAQAEQFQGRASLSSKQIGSVVFI